MIDVEPGRSLVDQAGISVFQVRAVRPIGKRWVVVVDGNNTHMSESWFDSEFFVDPILSSSRKTQPKLFEAAITGNTCLEGDYIALPLYTVSC